MLFFFQNFKGLQAYSIRDSENLAAHPQKEFSGVPSPPWPLTFKCPGGGTPINFGLLCVAQGLTP